MQFPFIRILLGSADHTVAHEIELLFFGLQGGITLFPEVNPGTQQAFNKN